MDAEFQFLRVSDNLSAFPDHSPVLFGFSPEIGATIHAGNVENGDAFKEDVAQVHPNPVTLRGREKRSPVSILSTSQYKVLCVVGGGGSHEGCDGSSATSLLLSEAES